MTLLTHLKASLKFGSCLFLGAFVTSCHLVMNSSNTVPGLATGGALHVQGVVEQDAGYSQAHTGALLDPAIIMVTQKQQDQQQPGSTLHVESHRLLTG